MPFDLEKFLPYRLYQAAEHTSREFSESYKEAYGITRTEWRVTFNIGQYGPISAADIARRSGIAKPKISRVVFRLEERGWIERIHSRENRRTHLLQLTQQGESNTEELRNLAAAFNQKMRKLLGASVSKELVETLLAVENADLRE